MSDEVHEPDDNLPPLHHALDEDAWSDVRSERIDWTVMVGTGDVCVKAPTGNTARGRSLPQALSALYEQLA